MVELFDSSVWQQGTYSGGGGFAGALTKASEGRSFADPAYPRHIASFRAEQRRNPAFIPGAYHFSRADLGNRPEDEADWFLTVVGDPRGMLLAHDAESAGGSQAWCQAFADRLAARLQGYEAAFYSYRVWIVQRGVGVARSWLWLAWPDANGPLPSIPPWGRPAMQQYGVGPVPGLVGNVDRNRFFGTPEQLRALTVGGTPTPTQGDPPMAVGQCLFLNGVNHVFLLGADGVVKWSATNGGAGGLQNPETAYVNVPCFSTDIRDVWVSQDRGPARPDGSGDVIDRILLFAAFGDGSWSFCVLNPTDSSYKIAGWSEPLPGMHLRARVPMYQGQTGAPAPPVTDEHIGEVARAAVKARL